MGVTHALPDLTGENLPRGPRVSPSLTPRPEAEGPAEDSRALGAVHRHRLKGQECRYFRLCGPRHETKGIVYVVFYNYLKHSHLKQVDTAPRP